MKFFYIRITSYFYLICNFGEGQIWSRKVDYSLKNLQKMVYKRSMSLFWANKM